MADNTISRIKKFIDKKNISIRLFEQTVGMSNGSFASQLKNNKTIGVDKLENILHAYPEICPEWLLTGNGSMLKQDIPQNETAHIYECMLEKKEAEISRLNREIGALHERLEAFRKIGGGNPLCFGVEYDELADSKNV